MGVVGALCVLDLLLTFGVVRRLREHGELITRINVPDVPVIGVAAGESPSTFSAVSTRGDLLTGPGELRMAAFFSTTCSICPERVPSFVAYLKDHGIARDTVLAVVRGPQAEPPAYLARLADAARVCLEQEDGELAKSFKVVGYPAFCLLDGDGVVLAASHDPAMLPEPAPA